MSGRRLACLACALLLLLLLLPGPVTRAAARGRWDAQTALERLVGIHLLFYSLKPTKHIPAKVGELLLSYAKQK